MWLRITEFIDRIVDGLSMYRLLEYYLGGLLLAAIGLSAAGDMHYSGVQVAASAGLLVAACWVINKVFAFIFRAAANPESSILTGLILALIIQPTLGDYGYLFMAAAAGLAIASKYILTINRKHIFNPAAVAVVLTAWGPRQSADWWVGTAAMLPFVLIGGVLIMRKVRREHMVLTFFIVTTIVTAVMAVATHSGLSVSMRNMILTSAVPFLAFVMLTEPYTSPTTRQKQLWYAAIVGLLTAPQVHFGKLYTTPELALVVGNIFAYIVSSKTKLFLTLQARTQIAKDTLEFAFIPTKKLAYQPGQYMEWTLPHKSTDSRGARRWFTLASSPTEERLLVGVKFYKRSSSYKKAMLAMDHDTQIVAAQIAGDFVMPRDKERKLIFIAGGIGVTPFRSMLKYLVDTQERRPIRVMYSARTEDDFAYADVFEAARHQLGIPTAYVISDRGARITKPHTVHGTINKELIKRSVPDYQECMFYISGTHPMVEALQETLAELGVHRRNIKVDFFSGYA